MRGSIQVIKSHEWFAGWDWDNLLSRQYKPPLKPDSNINESHMTLKGELQTIMDAEVEEVRPNDIIEKSPENWDAEF